MKPSIVVDTLFARAVALRVGELNDLGEQDAVVSLEQLGIAGIIGPPEGRALGSPGDILVRLDVGQIWQKETGERTKEGWALRGGQGVPGPQGATGTTGPTGPSGSMVNAKLNVASGGANGSRIGVGFPSVISGLPSQASQTAPTSTNLLTSLSRSRVRVGPGADLVAGWRSDMALWWRGNAAGLGGFDIRWRFALASFALGFRAFYGFRAITSEIPGTTDPSELVNIIGIGFDAGSSQWAIMHRGTISPTTVIPLGASFNVATTDAISLQLTASPNGSDVDWIARNLSTGALVSNTISDNLPASDVFLSAHEWTSTGDDATIEIFNEWVDGVSVDPVP